MKGHRFATTWCLDAPIGRVFDAIDPLWRWPAVSNGVTRAELLEHAHTRCLRPLPERGTLRDREGDGGDRRDRGSPPPAGSASPVRAGADSQQDEQDDRDEDREHNDRRQ